MKSYHSAVCLSLAVLAALGFAGPAGAQVQVPLNGGLVGIDVGVPIPNTTFSTVTVQATGNATYLGNFKFVEVLTVNTLTKSGSGSFLFTTVNGDTVFGTVSGQGTFTPPNVLALLETGIITGGTGRFAGATGSITIMRIKNTVTGATTATFKGVISSPAP